MSIWINGQPATQLDASDRGLSYGDGLFRTLRLLDGAPLAWRWHWARLQHACAAQRLPCPEAELLLAELAAVSAEWPDAVAKLTLTRGVGPRGYAPPAAPQPTRIVQAGSRVAPPAERYSQGVAVHACALRLGLQPALAGQHAAYTALQLRLWRRGQRRNDALGVIDGSRFRNLHTAS